MTPDVLVLPDEAAVADAVAEALAARLRAPGRHDVVLTGGGVGTAALAALPARSEGIDWSQVHLWWGDERFLPDGDRERNATEADSALIDRISIPPGNVHRMPADVGQGAEAAAAAYADELARASVDGIAPDFAICLLGIGPEGHVASLFPGAPGLHAAAPVIAVHDSPKPPPTRVSLSLAAIRSAREVWVIASGSAKAEAVAGAIDPATRVEELPAAGARGRERTVLWLDEPAAALVPPPAS